MELPLDAISEFENIFEAEFGRVLSDDEAHERAESFMRVVILILRPRASDSCAIKYASPGVDVYPSSGTLGRNHSNTSNLPT